MPAAGVAHGDDNFAVLRQLHGDVNFPVLSVAVGVDDGVGHGLADGGLHVGKLLDRGVKLRGQRRRNTGIALIDRLCRQDQPDLVDDCHT